MRDMLGLMKQAQAMQEKIQAMQAEMERLEVEGQSGGGMVRVTLSAKGQLRSVAIDDQLLKPEEKQILEDLIVTALRGCAEKSRAPDGGENAGHDRRPFLAARHEAAVLMARFNGGRVAGPEIERLIQLLARLPGLGPRSARRAALHLIRKREQLLGPLAEAMQRRARKNRRLLVCGNVDTRDPCTICARRAARPFLCSSSSRPSADLWALERAAALNARYHVLGGALSPLDGVGPKDLNLASLVERVARGRSAGGRFLPSTPPSTARRRRITSPTSWPSIMCKHDAARAWRAGWRRTRLSRRGHARRRHAGAHRVLTRDRTAFPGAHVGSR